MLFIAVKFISIQLFKNCSITVSVISSNLHPILFESCNNLICAKFDEYVISNILRLRIVEQELDPN